MHEISSYKRPIPPMKTRVPKSYREMPGQRIGADLHAFSSESFAPPGRLQLAISCIFQAVRRPGVPNLRISTPVRATQSSKGSRADPIPALGKGRPSVLPRRLPHVLWGHYLLHPEYGKVAPWQQAQNTPRRKSSSTLGCSPRRSWKARHRGDLRGEPRRGPGTRLDKTRASPNRTGPCKTLRFFYVRLYSQISRTASIVLARNDRNDTKAFCSPHLWQWSFKAPDSSTSAAFVSDDL